MAFRLGNATANSARNKSTNAIVQAVDVGAANTSGRCNIYTGTQPANPETAATGTLLVTLIFANPAFAAASNGSAGLAGGTAVSATVAASGTAGWFRVVDRDNNPIFDGSVGTTGQDMNFDNTAFVQGGTATLNSMAVNS